MIYTLKTKLKFGKYKGKNLQEILNIDPLYIEWCINNVDEFNLNKKAWDETIQILFKVHKMKNLKKLRVDI